MRVPMEWLRTRTALSLGGYRSTRVVFAVDTWTEITAARTLTRGRHLLPVFRPTWVRGRGVRCRGVYARRT